MVGLVVVGLGDVGSSILAGIEAARAHLVHPWGSLVEAGGAGRKPEHGGSQALRLAAPFANLSDLALGAFEIKDDDAYRAALRSGHLSRSLVDELRPQLRHIRAMSGARHAPTRRHLADALAEDLRGFAEHNGCTRGVVVCTAPGLRELPGKPLFSPSELWDALEASGPDVSPALVYAAAVFAIVRWAVNSSPGHVWQAIRENELRVQVLGLKPYTYKLISYVLASLLATVGGIVYLLLLGGANIDVTTASFVGVNRIRLADDLNSRVSVIGRSAPRAAARCDCRGITKTSGADSAIATTTRATRARGNPIAEAGAGDSPGHSTASASAVAFTRGAPGEIERTDACDGQLGI